MPDDTTLIRWANLIQPKTLEKFNQRITQLAIERKVTRGRKLRTDGTVVESTIHPLSDSRLLADSVRVLARSVARSRTILQTAGKKIQERFEDFTKTAKGISRKIGETLRTKKEATRSEMLDAKRGGESHLPAPMLLRSPVHYPGDRSGRFVGLLSF